jgi:hypothetical protein
MTYLPKVKTTAVVAKIGTGLIEDKLCSRGEFTPGKLPAGGFNPVWNFKNNEPNDYFTRKQSPTSGGGKKVY